jgi:hypothetical protein
MSTVFPCFLDQINLPGWMRPAVNEPAAGGNEPIFWTLKDCNSY